MSELDVVNAYRTFLGRDPESSETVQQMRKLGKNDFLRQIVESSEFNANVLQPIRAKRLPATFAAPRGKVATDWAANFLPLSRNTQVKLAASANRLSDLYLILADPMTASHSSNARQLYAQPDFLAGLLAIAERIGPRSPVGVLEVIDDTEVRGFVLDERSPSGSLTVELWIDGVFAGATPADGYRSDLEERFGGSGRHGFAFENYITFDTVPDRPLRIEVRERGSGLSFGAQTVTPHARLDAQQLSNLSRQLEDARRALDRIDHALKQMGGSFGHIVDNWDTYWRTFYARSPLTEAIEAEQAAAFQWRPRLGIVIPTRLPDAVELADTMASLEAQTYREFDHQVLRFPDDNDASAAPSLHWGNDYTVVLPPGDRLAPGALHAIAKALQGSAHGKLIYADADRFLRRAYGPALHADPVLRPDFDRDLLLQSPYLGRLVVAETSLLRDVLATGGDLRPYARDDLWLRLTERVEDHEVHHIARVLHHEASSATAPTQPSKYLDAVRAHLARRSLEAEAVLSSDTALPDAEDAQFVRVVWPIASARPRAAVIVPTRDRVDLLKPCLDSLIEARGSNSVELEILVLDNGSTEPKTLSLLQTLAAEAKIRVLEYPHPFNWSAINNHAARQTEAEVLVFLNNDTVVLTPDWCDELYRQAMRPEIGAVGARMLYADGTIQHAGIILGCANAIGFHEGAGAPLSDPGYLGRRNLVHRAAALTGACLATRAELFQRLGGFDEVRLAVNANDMDYCLRVRHAGFAALYDPRCTIYHFESKSRGHTLLDEARLVHSEREMEIFAQRWGDYSRHDPFFNPHFDRMSLPFTRLGDPRSVAP